MVTTTNVCAAGARNKVLRGCALALALVSLAATGAAAKDKIKVGLILPSYDQIRWQNGDQPCFEKEGRSPVIMTAAAFLVLIFDSGTETPNFWSMLMTLCIVKADVSVSPVPFRPTTRP